MKAIKVNKDIVLKQLQLEDAKDIFETIDSQREYLGKWLPFVDSTKSIEDSLGFIKSVINAPANLKENVFVIQYQNEFAGIVGFKNTDILNKKTEIGYWLSNIYQKKGIITKSVRCLIDFAFDEMKLNRIQIKCAVGNESSKNIPKKLNFRFEGIERAGQYLSGGIFSNLEVYSLLSSENNKRDVL